MGWAEVKKTYEEYAGGDHKLEGRDFKKLCDECALYDRKFQKTQLDLVYAKYQKTIVGGKKANHIDFEQFKDCLRDIAKRKGVPTSAVQESVAGHAPEMNATKADKVRLNDDTSTYTGAHTQNEHHAAKGAHHKHEADRHNRLAQEWEGKERLNRRDWRDVEDLFPDFCTDRGTEGMSGRDFKEMCLDCDFFEHKSKVAATREIDIVFTHVRDGRHHIGFESFLDAILHVSEKTGKSPDELKELILSTGAPKLDGTVAQKNRFHDDPEM